MNIDDRGRRAAQETVAAARARQAPGLSRGARPLVRALAIAIVVVVVGAGAVLLLRSPNGQAPAAGPTVPPTSNSTPVDAATPLTVVSTIPATEPPVQETTTVPETTAALPPATAAVSRRLILSPAAGPTGTQVLLQGSGFTEWAGQSNVPLILSNQLAADVVHTYIIPDVSEAGDFDITVAIPRRMSVPQGGGRSVVTPLVPLDIAIGMDLFIEPDVVFTVTAGAPSLFVLGGEGLGAGLDFGSSFDDTLEALQAAFGDPQAETGWWDTDDPSHPSGPYCPGTSTAEYTWGNLTVMFATGDTRSSPPGGEPHFIGYWIVLDDNPLEIFTEAAIGIGSLVFDLESEYDDVAVIYSDHLSEWSFNVDGFSFSAPTPRGFWGTLTGSDGADSITAMWAGSSCGD